MRQKVDNKELTTNEKWLVYGGGVASAVLLFVTEKYFFDKWSAKSHEKWVKKQNKEIDEFNQKYSSSPWHEPFPKFEISPQKRHSNVDLLYALGDIAAGGITAAMTKSSVHKEDRKKLSAVESLIKERQIQQTEQTIAI